MKSDITKQDLLLLMLYLNDSKPITGMFKIQKMMFLLTEEIVPAIISENPDEQPLFKDLYDFVSFPFGPFSEKLSEDIQFFNFIHFINKHESQLGIDFNSVDDWEQDEYIHILSEDDYIYHFGLCRKTNSNGYVFQLTETGIQYVKDNIIDNFSSHSIEKLTALRQKTDSLSHYSILKYIATNYTKMIDKSSFSI